MPVVGFLHVAFPGPYTQHLIAFRQGLKQSGYIEGQNVATEYRWAYSWAAMKTGEREPIGARIVEVPDDPAPVRKP